jgi:hypothetical protein
MITKWVKMSREFTPAGALPDPFRFSRALFPGRERNNEAQRGVRETKNLDKTKVEY